MLMFMKYGTPQYNSGPFLCSIFRYFEIKRYRYWYCFVFGYLLKILSSLLFLKKALVPYLYNMLFVICNLVKPVLEIDLEYCGYIPGRLL